MKLRCLYLASWYPHRYDAMEGLFVRKHAVAAVRAGADVCVLYLYKKKKNRGTEIVEQTTDGVREVYVYYGGSFILALLRGWREVKRRWGVPQVCQLNVITKDALLPLWLRMIRRVPYIVVEHWSGYLPQNRGYAHSGLMHRWLTKMTAKYAALVMTVSEALENAMKTCGIKAARWERVNNVVDDFFYSVRRQPQKIRTLLHVSCFDEKAKNVKCLLRAVKRLSEERHDFCLVLVGTGADYNEVRRYADSLNFPADLLRWTGELSPHQVAQEMSEADVFVMFSRYENAPVVISESLAAGLPVVATRVGGIPEMVTDDCGVLVESEDETAMKKALGKILDNLSSYDSEALRRQAAKYNYDNVGKFLCDVYRSCMVSSLNMA